MFNIFLFIFHYFPLFSRFFEDIELIKDKDSTKYRFKKDGKKHTLIIQEATLEYIGMYHAWTNGGHTKGELEVEGTTRRSYIQMCLLLCEVFLKQTLFYVDLLYFVWVFCHVNPELRMQLDVSAGPRASSLALPTD